jgi:hypothetical protein
VTIVSTEKEGGSRNSVGNDSLMRGIRVEPFQIEFSHSLSPGQ